MYLSALLINVGDNPDRPRPGRLWLRNAYRVHQRLCMAFPSVARVADDSDYLKPFSPADFAQAHVHVARTPGVGFLFRVDPLPSGRAAILVLSATKPDWDYAFHNAGHFLAAPPQAKPYNPSFAAGESFRFRLRANPTKRLPPPPGTAKQDGPRVQLFGEDEQLAWLARKGGAAGFALVDCRVSAVERQVSRKGEGPQVVHQAVTFDGLLRVTDPEALLAALAGGIGSGKGFGFGLLSLARG